MERGKAGTKEKRNTVPITTYLKYNKNEHNILFYKIWKKYNEIQLKKIDLNKRKMANHATSPDMEIQSGHKIFHHKYVHIAFTFL